MITVRHTWSMSHEFACHSAACIPPVGGSSPGPNPAQLGRPHFTQANQSKYPGQYHTWDEKGEGGGMGSLENARRYVKGRETTLKRVATQAKQRANAPLTSNHQHTLNRFKGGDGRAGATKAEAKPLVDRGLIQPISGKGRGQGNTPQWELTAKGKAHLNPQTQPHDGKTFPKIKIAGKERKIVGETETHWHVESQTPGGKPLPFRKTDVAHLIQK